MPPVPAGESENVIGRVPFSRARGERAADAGELRLRADRRQPLLLLQPRAQPVEVVERVEAFFDAEGLDALDPFHRGGHHPGNFARPRGLEVAARRRRGTLRPGALPGE